MVSDVLNKTTNDICFNINNSYQCADFLNNITIPSDYILISLDVKNLFPSIPLNLIIEAIENRWPRIMEHTKLNMTTFLELIRFCYNGKPITSICGKYCYE
jgi:hypothetical protein